MKSVMKVEPEPVMKSMKSAIKSVMKSAMKSAMKSSGPPPPAAKAGLPVVEKSVIRKAPTPSAKAAAPTADGSPVGGKAPPSSSGRSAALKTPLPDIRGRSVMKMPSTKKSRSVTPAPIKRKTPVNEEAEFVHVAPANAGMPISPLALYLGSTIVVIIVVLLWFAITVFGFPKPEQLLKHLAMPKCVDQLSVLLNETLSQLSDSTKDFFDTQLSTQEE